MLSVNQACRCISAVPCKFIPLRASSSQNIHQIFPMPAEAVNWEDSEDFSLEKEDSQVDGTIAPSEGPTPTDSLSPVGQHWGPQARAAAQEPEDDHAAVLKIASQTMPPAARLFYGVFLGSPGMVEAAIAQGAPSDAKATFEVVQSLDTVASLSPGLPSVHCALGDTPLHVALRQGHTGIARNLLCIHSAHINLKNRIDETAIELCSQETRDLIVAELASLGIDAGDIDDPEEDPGELEDSAVAAASEEAPVVDLYRLVEH